MQTTKSQILALLKRRGRETVDLLSTDLGLASMTVRQHLTSLERDGLVRAAAERQLIGRPHFVYSLTEKGEEAFPKRYDRLVAELLVELGRIDPYEFASLSSTARTSYIVDRIADRTVAQHTGRLREFSLQQRVVEVAAILHQESGFAEWSRTADGYELRDYNCMYRSLMADDDIACAWHRRVVGRLLGLPPAEVTDEPAGGACCRYAILEPAHERPEFESLPQSLPARVTPVVQEVRSW